MEPSNNCYSVHSKTRGTTSPRSQGSRSGLGSLGKKLHWSRSVQRIVIQSAFTPRPNDISSGSCASTSAITIRAEHICRWTKIRLKLDLLNRQRWEILWRFPMLMACTIDTGELQPDGDSNEWPEKRHDCIYRRDTYWMISGGAPSRGKRWRLYVFILGWWIIGT